MSKKNREQDVESTMEDTVATSTPEQIAAKKEKAEAKNAARKRILAFLNDNADQLGALATDIRMFVGKAPSAKAKGTVKSVNSDLRDAFLAAGDKGLSEMDIFKMFKIGRPEMVTKIRILVLCPNPKDRVWVKFDEASETYFVVGTGEEPPADWDGYVPSSKIQGL